MVFLILFSSFFLTFAVLLLLYRFYFLRKPVRNPPQGRVIVSPAYGKIVRIVEFGKKPVEEISKGLLGRFNILVRDVSSEGYLIVIMMTPFDVHYQRSPVDGKVEKVTYSKGLFLNAVRDASSMHALQNERNEILISNNEIGKIKVVQVAGFLARRIRCFVQKGQKIDKGRDIGLICLGSQVLLVIPKLRLAVKEGQRVVDGETIIARF